MMAKREIQAWLDTLPADALIGIDDGGLALETTTGYLEVGGYSEEDEQHA
jgi:hypothetical protein